MNNTPLTIHTDGGSRGNPGPAAAAFVVERGSELVFQGSKFLGNVTNNFAEYSGVLIALEWVLSSEIPAEDLQINFVLDSELVVRQINGLYKVKDLNLQKLFQEVKKLISETGKKIVFSNVPRNQNKLADLLVNEELDRNI